MTTATVAEWYRAIGEFVVLFEQACQNARTFIGADLPGNSHESEQKKTTVLQNLEAHQLAATLRALLGRTQRYDEPAKALIRDFFSLIERRNFVVHSPWFVGWAVRGESTDSSSVVAFSPERQASKPDALDVRKLDFDELEKDIENAKKLKAGLIQLLDRCFPNGPTP